MTTGSAEHCPLCGAVGVVRLEEKCAGYELLDCDGCDFTFSSPMRPADAAHYEAQFMPQPRLRWDFIRLLSDRPRPGGRLLELGCDDGRFLHQAKRMGYQVSGIDICEQAIRYAGRKYRLENLRVADILDPESFRSLESFDVIVIFQLLEHLPDPAGFLRSVSQSLKPGGVLAVSTPHARRWTLKFGREHWDFPPIHLTRWTVKSLRAVLEKAGLTIVSVIEQPGDDLSTVRAYLETRFLQVTSLGIASRLGAEASQSAASPARSRRYEKTLYLLHRLKSLATNMVLKLGPPLALPYVRSLKLRGQILYALASKAG